MTNYAQWESKEAWEAMLHHADVWEISSKEDNSHVRQKSKTGVDRVATSKI